ncbi:hypothetical protein C4N15_07170 [Fusobacterium necrophorum subsp. funduliforme]|uniref:hypothetical protein n=1 Tax=Fusobacterium necrophorum TaxID=859 RepID=UPI000245DB9F|nr:hypothetical protein [Fusobacterium necrophorum]AVQ21437.1 hypothetical protein C4N15_07170 [Fusobacterium necrophorum subsp. funduliforme]EHO19672.1 hypothetical protein HMPREF9466_01603 [Fusobacterium necrophorum subsp. funduliforme 1_1_36S]
MSYSFTFVSNNKGEFAIKYKYDDNYYIIPLSRSTDPSYNQEVTLLEMTCKYTFEEIQEIVLKEITENLLQSIHCVNLNEYLPDLKRYREIDLAYKLEIERDMIDILDNFDFYIRVKEFLEDIEKIWQ